MFGDHQSARPLGEAAGAADARALVAVSAFGDDPGNLAMRVHLPPRPARRPALVVVLHGCTQTAEDYDRGSGWSKLADRHGFVLLYPEQRRTNNPRNCFNWFRPEDTRRGAGEAGSIAQMIATAVAAYRVDPARVFVTGLSAGGAMACAMLAAYPETFRAGAIVAGLPYGGAATVGTALDIMAAGRIRPASDWGDAVRAASGHRGPWPAVSVWQGTADRTVAPANAEEIVKQWCDVHRLGSVAPAETRVGPATRRAWCGADGAARVVAYTLPGLAHGTPIDGTPIDGTPPAGGGAAEDGTPGPYFLAAGLWSSRAIAADWGLTGDAAPMPRRKPFKVLGFEI